MARRGAVQDLTEPMTEADVFYRLLNFYGRYYWNGCILAQTFYKHGKLRDSHAE